MRGFMSCTPAIPPIPAVRPTVALRPIEASTEAISNGSNTSTPAVCFAQNSDHCPTAGERAKPNPTWTFVRSGPIS